MWHGKRDTARSIYDTYYQAARFILHSRYVFAKTSSSGLTRYYGLRISSSDDTALFEYRPEGLSGGFRTAVITDLSLSGDQLHHLAVTVYDRSVLVYINGGLHAHVTLTGSLEDGPGTMYLGGIPGTSNFFSGEIMSLTP